VNAIAQLRADRSGSPESALRGREFQVLSAVEARAQDRAGANAQSGTEADTEAPTLEAVGRLTGGVAHDFNNLLTGILLYCDLLIAELKPGSRSYQHAREIRGAAEQGAEVIRQLLAVARPQAAEPRVTGFNEVVAGMRDLLTRLIGENFVLRLALAEDLSMVRIDPAQVQQILLNVVLNARDAMPEGGEIIIATRNCDNVPPVLEDTQAQQYVELAVSDTGCGMDAATLERAFEPFFTTKSQTTKNQTTKNQTTKNQTTTNPTTTNPAAKSPGSKDAKPGTGLGLATAYRLAKLAGGTMAAESRPGKGTRVSLLLPRVDFEPASDEGEPESAETIAEDFKAK
jgi:two-component system, cell cycle sensor histidine kinase and response regulator CckA